jgi:hypothetical protein
LADRAFVLGRLQRELQAARDVHEDGYAAELERRIAALSQGSPGNPATETTAARRPARSK